MDAGAVEQAGPDPSGGGPPIVWPGSIEPSPEVGTSIRVVAAFRAAGDPSRASELDREGGSLSERRIVRESPELLKTKSSSGL